MNGKYLRMQSRGYQMRGQTEDVFQLLGGGKDRKHKGDYECICGISKASQGYQPGYEVVFIDCDLYNA